MSASHRRKLIADALASPLPAPDTCSAREVLSGVWLRIPPSDYITRSHIRRAHEVARQRCGMSGSQYEEQLQSEYARLTDAEPWYWNQLWPGGIGLARHVLEHPELVCGRTVLEFGSGIGLLAVSAAVAGAVRVVATDIEPAALAFAERSAADNRIADGVLATVVWDWHHPPEPEGFVARLAPFDVVLLPDVMYDSDAVERLGVLAPSLVAPGGCLLFSDGTDRPYGGAHTKRLVELLCAPPASFALHCQSEVVAGAEAEDGGAAPARPVQLVSLTRGGGHGEGQRLGLSLGVHMDACGLVQRCAGRWAFRIASPAS